MFFVNYSTVRLKVRVLVSDGITCIVSMLQSYAVY